MKRIYHALIIYGLILAVVISLIFTTLAIILYRTGDELFYHSARTAISFSSVIFFITVMVYYITTRFGWIEWNENFFMLWKEK
jgi:hypothetical protein